MLATTYPNIKLRFLHSYVNVWLEDSDIHAWEGGGVHHLHISFKFAFPKTSFPDCPKLSQAKQYSYLKIEEPSKSKALNKSRPLLENESPNILQINI